MNPFIIIGIVVIGAYILQVIFGIRQLKNFNLTYQRLRHQGRVAIGRRSGRIQAGTIVMFAITDEGIVLDAFCMQGVTVLASFKHLPAYIGEDLHYLDHYHPLVQEENRLLQTAIEDARNVFVCVEAGTYKDVPRSAAPFNLPAQCKLVKEKIARASVRKCRSKKSKTI